MKTSEAWNAIGREEFLEQIYQFSYHRCGTSAEAEELCSDILIVILTGLKKQDEIQNFYGFVWTIAHRVYADFCEKRRKSTRYVSLENSETDFASLENEVEELLEEIAQKEQVKRILHEIAFLSKVYREVMILYYLDEMSVRKIAGRLGILETTVKQRLFSARNIVRKEVEGMNKRNFVLKPIELDFVGTGKPAGNNPAEKAERAFSQNMIYLCREKPKTAGELAEELCVPMPYIEEELEIQCRGENGEYGMLRKLENGKYLTNVLMVDRKELEGAADVYRKYVPEYEKRMKTVLEEYKEQLLKIPFLSPQEDLSMLLWTLLPRVVWKIKKTVGLLIAETSFADVKPVEREFSCVAFVGKEGENIWENIHFYGCDGTGAVDLDGYKSVLVTNINGKRVKEHFDCTNNLAQDPQLRMTLRSIDGLVVSGLTEEEKEVAAKAVACGYLRKKGEILEPAILVLDKKDEKTLYEFVDIVNEQSKDLLEQMAKDLGDYMKQHIPAHLLDEYVNYTQLVAGSGVISDLVEQCIQDGILKEPKVTPGTEGVLMVVEKLDIKTNLLDY